MAQIPPATAVRPPRKPSLHLLIKGVTPPGSVVTLRKRYCGTLRTPVSLRATAAKRWARSNKCHGINRGAPSAALVAHRGLKRSTAAFPQQSERPRRSQGVASEARGGVKRSTAAFSQRYYRGRGGHTLDQRVQTGSGRRTHSRVRRDLSRPSPRHPVCTF